MPYTPSPTRYDKMLFNRCGRSGLKLPAISLGLWHNFGFDKSLEFEERDLPPGVRSRRHPFRSRQQLRAPAGLGRDSPSATSCAPTFAAIATNSSISTKAGYLMWPGPYGEWGGRKYMLASLDQSLKRMGLDYVDIFYSHRFDPETPLEETMGALDPAVRQGKALYVGISSYNSRRTKEAAAILKRLGTPCLIHQPSYSMINRWIEDDHLLDTLEEEGVGAIVFSPLAQGLLDRQISERRPRGQPRDGEPFLQPGDADADRTSSARVSSTRSPSGAARRWPRWRWRGR